MNTMKNKEKVMVTGARGCLGANLVKGLIEKGYQVNALVYSKKEHPYLAELKKSRKNMFKEFNGNVLDKKSLKKAMKGCKFVYHTAGIVSYSKKDFDMMMKVHVEGTRNVLEVAQELGVKKLVYTSSSAVIGITSNKNKPLSEKAEPPKRYAKMGYVLTKKLAEQEVQEFVKKGFNAVIVNPTSFYGAGDINMNQGEIVKNISKGTLRFAFPGGNSVVAVRDVVEGHILAMKKGRKGARYILSNENFDFLTEFNIVAKELDTKKIKVVLPKALYYVIYPLAFMVEKIADLLQMPCFHAEALVIVFKYRYFNSAKARKELGWKPKQSFRQAIREAITFYKDNKLIN